MSMTNCPNCGSAKEVGKAVCPFCGTSSFDLTDIDLSDISKPCIVRFKIRDKIVEMKSYIGLANFETYSCGDIYRNEKGMLCRRKNSNEITKARIEFISY